MTVVEWRPVVGWEGLYEVSTEGQVRSLDKIAAHPYGTQVRRGKVLWASPNSNGYLNVTLQSRGEGRRKNRLVHQLVLEAFVGPRPDGMEDTRHLNGVQTDNRLANLVWGTTSENMQDRVAHGRDPNARKITCPRGHPYDGVRRGGRERFCRTCARDQKRARKLSVDERHPPE